MLLLLSAWVSAAPLALPAEEDPALWAGPMALHGFERAAATTGARARLIEGEGQWTLIVVDSTGRTHSAQVPAPMTPADREDTLALAARLLAPTTALELPELPELPEPLKPAPPIRTPPPDPERPVSLAAGAHPLPPRVLATAEPLPYQASPRAPALPPSPQRVASARVGTSFGQRPDMELSAGLGADASWGAPALQVGLAGTWAAPHPLPLVEGVQANHAALLAGVWFLPQIGASVGIHAGVARRSWTLDQALVLQQTLPTARLMLGWRVPLGRVSLEPAAELQLDLARTELQLGDRALGTLAPWQAGLSVAFRAQTDPFSSPDALPQ